MNAPATATASLPRWKKIVFSLVLAAVAAGFLEATAYAYLRLARGYGGGEFLQYQFDAYKNIGLTPNWVDTRGVRHNAQGFRRSSDVARVKPPGTYRIFLMGASTAYGLGGLFNHIQTEYGVLDNTQTIDAYLEKILGRRLPYERVEVINAAVPSIWTHHHLINLNQTILGYDPDMILFLDGWNDHFFHDRGHDQFESYGQLMQAASIMGPPTLSSLIRMNGWWLFRRSAFAHVAVRAGEEFGILVSNALGDRPVPLDVPQALDDLQWVFERNALRMIRRNVALLRDEGIPAIVMLQPMLILERRHLGRMPPIERELFAFNASWQSGWEEFMVKGTPIVSRRIRETVTPLGARYLDLTGIFAESNGEQVFTDYVHLTPEGNRLLAEHVAEEVVSLASESHPRGEGTHK
jgi:hypothetical protein